MIQLFNLILYEPLLNLLVFFYNTIALKDLGLAIILLTFFIKILLYPLTLSQIRAQKSLTELQPKISEVRKKYGSDKMRVAKETMELYRQHKVNPFSSCLSLIIQLPILIAVYQVFIKATQAQPLSLYPFIYNPGQLNTLAFGFLDLAKKSFPLALLTGVVQFFQTKMFSTKKPPAAVAKDKGARDENLAAVMNKQMVIMMPLFTVIIGMTLPSGLIFYWLINLLLTILQQVIILKKNPLQPPV